MSSSFDFPHLELLADPQLNRFSKENHFSFLPRLPLSISGFYEYEAESEKVSQSWLKSDLSICVAKHGSQPVAFSFAMQSLALQTRQEVQDPEI